LGQIKRSSLLQNYPNPFNPETWIPYRLAMAAHVEISIYDIAGNHIRTLQLGLKPRGEYTVKDEAAYWNGRSDTGERVSSGIYFYRLSAGNYSATRRMVIVE
jgi:flagellar hook assembly protein FlgD